MGLDSHLTLGTFQNIFEKFEPGVIIEFFEEAQGSGRGDNYTATLYRVHLSGHYKKTHDGGRQTKWDKSVICKRLPNSVALREAYKSDLLFRNEVEFYTRIIPELISFQKGKTTEIFKAIPMSYLAKQDLLIMDLIAEILRMSSNSSTGLEKLLLLKEVIQLSDLLIRGFKMPDRKAGLTVDETKAALKEIAILHSLSLGYKLQQPKLFEELKKTVVEQIFNTENEKWYRNYYQQTTKNAIEMVGDVLPQNSKYVKKLNEFAESSTFFSRMIELVSKAKESVLSVICHGDCWTNNFLFLYDENGKVIETSVVDFQLIRYGSAAFDFSTLIYCCTSKKVRDEYLDSFINLYVNEMYKSLKNLGNIPTCFASEEECMKLFQKELKTYGKFAMGIALDIIPISTCSAEDAPDLRSSDTSSSSSEPHSAPTLDFPPNDLCRQKLTDVLIDLVDNGIL